MMRSSFLRSAVLSLLLFGLSIVPAAAGLDPESNTDGFDPAAESHRINEARRLNAISQQLELTRGMLWLDGFNPANPPIRQPIGFESGQTGPNRWMYRPVYGEDVAPPQTVPAAAPETLPAPDSVGPQLIPQAPAPSGAKAGDFIPPQDPVAPRRLPARPGPREFSARVIHGPRPHTNPQRERRTWQARYVSGKRRKRSFPDR